jgi:hypothetical protein
VCHTEALPFTSLKSIILRQKKNHGNSKKSREVGSLSEYFTIQKYILQNNPLKETKILQDIIRTL